MGKTLLDLDLVSQIVYLASGKIEEGEEEKVVRLEHKLSDWKRDVVGKKEGLESTNATKEQMSYAAFELERKMEGYWCEGEKCACTRTHWVFHSSESTCWECMHDPCACQPPLLFDEAENAYYRLFLSADGKMKTVVWMSNPTTNLARIRWKRV